MLQKPGAVSIRPKIPRFPSEIEWNGKNSGKFSKVRNTFWVHPLWWNFRNYRKFCVPFARDVGFSLPTKRELTWTLEKALMEWFSNSPDKYAGIVTSKYPFTRVNSLRIKQATVARSIASSLLSRIVQLIVSLLSCSKAAKMFKKSAIFKHYNVSPSMPWLYYHSYL